jgi:UV DNA damage endonuclease
MRIGYACINLSLDCRSSHTFRLKSYSQEMMERTVAANLSCLEEQLRFNLRHGILYFRISSDLIPFASHPVCDYPWQRVFAGEFKAIGNFVKKHSMRLTMHPDQFILINSPHSNVLENSLREIAYHAEVLDLMGLDPSHKIQVHVGGIYGDKNKSMARFVDEYRKLPSPLKRRLVVENDDRLYSLPDCLVLHGKTGIPVVFDALHHAANSNKESVGEALSLAASTWKKKDGPLMVDYSSQKKGGRPGAHAYYLDPDDFRSFLAAARGYDPDIMLELKSKERSALEAIAIAGQFGIQAWSR